MEVWCAFREIKRPEGEICRKKRMFVGLAKVRVVVVVHGGTERKWKMELSTRLR